jgi:hypothetical protein
MSKVQEQSQIVPVVEPNIISTPYGDDELLINTATGTRCTIPKFFTQIRTRCGGSQGNFAEITPDKVIDRGNTADVVVVDYRKVRLTLDKKNYVNHLFIELFCLPVSGELRELYVGKGQGDLILGNYSLRLTTFLINAETSAKDDKPKSPSKNMEMFDKCVNLCSLANQSLLNELSPEEMMKIDNLSDWLKNKGPNSIFNKVIEISFVQEKSGDFNYYSMKFTPRNPNNENRDIENQALLFAKKIREDVELHGHIRCLSERFLTQESYINAIHGGDSSFNAPQIEGEIVDETKLLTPAF